MAVQQFDKLTVLSKVEGLEASLAVMNQRLADPSISEAEKASLKEGIQKLQEKLYALKQK